MAEAISGKAVALRTGTGVCEHAARVTSEGLTTTVQHAAANRATPTTTVTAFTGTATTNSTPASLTTSITPAVPSTGPVPEFVATEEWQEILPG